jgi:hypothetical protein
MHKEIDELSSLSYLGATCKESIEDLVEYQDQMFVLYVLLEVLNYLLHVV